MCRRPLSIHFFRFIIEGVPIAMNRDTTTSPTADWGQLLWDPLRLSAMASEYAVDAWQRSILYADLLRQRGNQYQAHLRERVPTLTTLLLARAAQGEGPEAEDARRVRALVDGPLDTDEQLAAAVAALTGHPAIDEAWAITRGWAEQAKQALDPLPDSAVKAALEAFADYVVGRSA